MINKIIELEVLKQKVSECIKCPELVSNRTQTVFGVGNVNAKLMIVGEAPGKNEDKEGEPFVGEAGKLLNSMIAACGWKREDIFITNICRCRPPENRVPKLSEIENCSSFLQSTIEIVNPEFILLLGATAAKAILGMPLNLVRGTISDYKGRKVFVTYHPSYLLRNPSAKSIVWEDLQSLIKIMN